ncbi:Pla2g4c [Phodopus roborovskii]|uniref:Pla2g4c protein n=1 Tax=Phodopus roborovskii TaxID=109678 RepID=A0AAV0A8A0_PHORO|nr:Pla2g4c [Phodopus roborovskii]
MGRKDHILWLQKSPQKVGGRRGRRLVGKMKSKIFKIKIYINTYHQITCIHIVCVCVCVVEFQNNHDYTEKPCLEKQQNPKSRRESSHQSLWWYFVCNLTNKACLKIRKIRAHMFVLNTWDDIPLIPALERNIRQELSAHPHSVGSDLETLARDLQGIKGDVTISSSCLKRTKFINRKYNLKYKQPQNIEIKSKSCVGFNCHQLSTKWDVTVPQEKVTLKVVEEFGKMNPEESPKSQPSSNITDEAMQSREFLHLVDAGLAINTPYPLVLPPAREAHLILSFDFSAGDPLETIRATADYCQCHAIPFPDVREEQLKEWAKAPASCYILRGETGPVVMHFTLFNKDNCGGRKQYETIKLSDSYTPDLVTDLLKISKENVQRNKVNILNEMQNVAGKTGNFLGINEEGFRGDTVQDVQSPRTVEIKISNHTDITFKEPL